MLIIRMPSGCWCPPTPHLPFGQTSWPITGGGSYFGWRALVAGRLWGSKYPSRWIYSASIQRGSIKNKQKMFKNAPPAPQGQSARACAWRGISAEGHAGCAVGVMTFLILTSMLTLQEMIVAGTSHLDSWGSERRWLPPTRQNCDNGPSGRSVVYSRAVWRRHTSLVLDAVSSSLVVPVVFRTCVSTYWLEDQLHQHHEAKKVCIT